jgi:Na+/H+ antiporter NhaA
MVKRLKIFISSFTGILLIIFTLISFGLWTMEIEDRYGDLQEVYYKSQDGDLILLENKQNGLNKYGLIDKT